MPRDHGGEEIVATASGVKQSHVRERFDLICPTGLRRLAARYGLGAEKYTDFNWCGGDGDLTFQRARLNHLIKHVNEFLAHGNVGDDNLAAIAWNAFALMHYEENCQHHKAPIPGSVCTAGEENRET